MVQELLSGMLVVSPLAKKKNPFPRLEFMASEHGQGGVSTLGSLMGHGIVLDEMKGEDCPHNNQAILRISPGLLLFSAGPATRQHAQTSFTTMGGLVVSGCVPGLDLCVTSLIKGSFSSPPLLRHGIECDVLTAELEVSIAPVLADYYGLPNQGYGNLGILLNPQATLPINEQAERRLIQRLKFRHTGHQPTFIMGRMGWA